MFSEACVSRSVHRGGVGYLWSHPLSEGMKILSLSSQCERALRIPTILELLTA